jgi:hypothetical protein
VPTKEELQKGFKLGDWEVLPARHEIHRGDEVVRPEPKQLEVLLALAEYTDLSLGDLLEGIVLHAFEGKAPFQKATQDVIGQLKSVYGCDLTSADSHMLEEESR